MTWDSKFGCSNVVGSHGAWQTFLLCISEQSLVVEPQASSGAGKAFLRLHSLVTELFGFGDGSL